MFQASSLPIIRSFLLYSPALVIFMQVTKQSQDEFHPDSAWKQSSKTCMKLIGAECTVENS